MDVNKLEEATKMMEEFLKRLSVYLSSDNATEVFELNINLFARTQYKE